MPLFINIKRFRICYRPNIISVIVTKRGPPGSSGLYRTSGTIGQGVAKLYS